eukprot:768801-Hanusia_phi.AAC.8
MALNLDADHIRTLCNYGTLLGKHMKNFTLAKEMVNRGEERRGRKKSGDERRRGEERRGEERRGEERKFELKESVQFERAMDADETCEDARNGYMTCLQEMDNAMILDVDDEETAAGEKEEEKEVL